VPIADRQPPVVESVPLAAWAGGLARATRARAAVRYVAGVLLLAGVYYGAGRASLALQYTGPVAAIWLPVGVGAATLYLGGLRWAPGVVIGDLALADSSQPPGTVLGLTAGNTADIVVIALLLRHLLGPRATLDRLEHLGGMIVAIAAGAAITATVAMLSLSAGGPVELSDMPTLWRSWFLADASGSLVVIPLALAWAQPPSPLRRSRVWEGALMIGAVIVLSGIALSGDLPLTYIVFPALIWAVLRFGLHGATLAVAVAAVMAVGLTAHEVGPFVTQSITTRALSTQLYIAVAALTTLCLAAITAERRRAGTEVRRLAEEQAALRRVATLVARGSPAPALFAAVAEEVGRVLDADLANVLRYDADDAATVVAGWSERGAHVPVTTRLMLDGDSVAARVRESGRAARMDTYTDARGAHAARLRDLGVRSAVGAPIVVGARLWGVVVAGMTHGKALPDVAESRIAEFTELVATAIANADGRAQLAASRARVVEAGDRERRRIERNLHDGAQQRLVWLGIRLRMAAAKVPPGERELAAGLSEATTGLNGVLKDLQEISRGLHPSNLLTGGLGAALDTLGRRSAVPVDLDVRVEHRLPERVEVAAYYVVSEALANAAKHARASTVWIDAEERDGSLALDIRDDGVGGADPSRGSGLIGLRDRVEAAGGTIEVVSPAGDGTSMRVTLPTADERVPEPL
jgi:signal transduction histidine kinase